MLHGAIPKNRFLVGVMVFQKVYKPQSGKIEGATDVICGHVTIELEFFENLQ